LNSVTLGDAGETSDWEKSISRYTKVVHDLGQAFDDDELTSIMHGNYCPLIRCYAFTAWVAKESRPLTSEEIQNFMLRAARDSASYVILDWGCGSSIVQMFDYMLEQLTRPTCFVKNFPRLSKEVLKQILEVREPFFKAKDFEGNQTDWEEYKSNYIE